MQIIFHFSRRLPSLYTHFLQFWAPLLFSVPLFHWCCFTRGACRLPQYDFSTDYFRHENDFYNVLSNIVTAQYLLIDVSMKTLPPYFCAHLACHLYFTSMLFRRLRLQFHNAHLIHTHLSGDYWWFSLCLFPHSLPPLHKFLELTRTDVGTGSYTFTSAHCWNALIDMKWHSQARAESRSGTTWYTTPLSADASGKDRELKVIRSDISDSQRPQPDLILLHEVLQPYPTDAWAWNINVFAKLKIMFVDLIHFVGSEDDSTTWPHCEKIKFYRLYILSISALPLLTWVVSVKSV
jgi:hypothetical protein